MLQTASQETKTSNCLNGGKVAGRASKARQIKNLSVYSDKR